MISRNLLCEFNRLVDSNAGAIGQSTSRRSKITKITRPKGCHDLENTGYGRTKAGAVEMWGPYA